ncbi:discoidin domain-containing protein [Bacteroides salyersiae]|nr:discoidin domain-containing protein [Bacteroides salyersiae]
MILRKYLCFACAVLFIQSGYAKEQKPINLGETPRRFSKVVRQEMDLAKDARILCGTQAVPVINDGDMNTEWVANDAPGPSLLIDLHENKQAGKVKLSFKGNRVYFATVKVEVSLDNKQWNSLTDGIDRQQCELYKEGDISSVNNTVGYVATVTSTSLSVPIPVTYRYIKLSGLKCFSEKKEELPVRVSELAIHPVENDHPDQEMAGADFDDTRWEEVGIPHCYNEHDTYLNTSTGERCWRGEGWYRKKLFFDEKDREKEIFLEFRGVNLAAIVFVNGQAISGNTRVKQPGVVTHVGSSLPFVVNISKYIKWGEENQIAIKVSNAKNTFFARPGFGENEGFGQAMGGIVSPVYMHKKDKVHIPFNSYSPLNKWGTYFGTVSATPQEAVVRFQTNVENSSEHTRGSRTAYLFTR